MPTSKSPRTRADGCGFAIGTIVFTCAMLVLNGILVTAVYQWLYRNGAPTTPQHVKTVQLLLFVCPVVLLFVEWTLLDFGLRRIVFSRKEKERVKERGTPRK
jgi:hypothetical protein